MSETHTVPATAPLPYPAHPLLVRLVAETGAAVLDADSFDAWIGRPGMAMLVFAEAPERQKETLDVAVIVPELHALHGGTFRVGLLLPDAARALAPRYGFVRWPALVMLRDGRYVGAVEGVCDWAVYVGQLERLLAASPVRPPGVGIAVSRGSADASPPCH